MWNLSDAVMDRDTAEFIKRLGELSINDGVKATIQSTGIAFTKVFKESSIPISISQANLSSLERSLLKDGGVTISNFCDLSNVRFFLSKDNPDLLLRYLCDFNIKSTQWNGETEDEIHAYVETALSAPLNLFFGNTFRVTRNHKVETSAGRADYSLSKNGNQILRGEDKIAKLVKSQDPCLELRDKTLQSPEWERFYGPRVNYIFGYYSIGETRSLNLQFVLITKDGSILPLTKEPFNLCSFSGMLGCRFFVLSLYPHMLATLKAIESNVSLDWQISKESEGRFDWLSSVVCVGIHQGSACFVKEWAFKTRSKSASFFYNQSEISKVLPKSPYLMQYITVTHDLQLVRAKFIPFAIPWRVEFKNIVSVKKCLGHIFSAIKLLHEANLVHNDLRWDNIVMDTNENYVLVDYDLLSVIDKQGKVLGISGMNSHSHAPTIQEVHGFEVDFWGLGYLMHTIIVEPQAIQASVRLFGLEVMRESMLGSEKIELLALSSRMAIFVNQL